MDNIICNPKQNYYLQIQLSIDSLPLPYLDIMMEIDLLKIFHNKMNIGDNGNQTGGWLDG